MTLDEALSEAVQGAWVRAADMQPGSYVHYNFNGFRITFEGGSSSGWTPHIHDHGCEWAICGPPEPPKPVVLICHGVTSFEQAKLVAKHISKSDWGANPAEVLRSIALDTAKQWGLGVDHASFDKAAEYLEAAPQRDKWGRSI